MAENKDLYKRIKIAGFITFIPFVLAGGVVGGYLAGGYLKGKFPGFKLIMPLCIAIGLLASAFEVARIIRLAAQIERKD